MDDLISRKRALEEMTFSSGIEQDCILYVPLRDVNNHLKSLPSVQPELTEKVEDILTYLYTELHPIVSPEHWNVYSELYDMIKALSSAEPERKKGEWFLTDTMYACNQCHSVFYETSPFCPNCGAEMKGEE